MVFFQWKRVFPIGFLLVFTLVYLPIHSIEMNYLFFVNDLMSLYGSNIIHWFEMIMAPLHFIFIYYYYICYCSLFFFCPFIWIHFDLSIKYQCSTFRIYRQRDEIKTRQSEGPDSEYTHYKAIRITYFILNTNKTIIIQDIPIVSQSKPCQILVSFQKKTRKKKGKEKTRTVFHKTFNISNTFPNQ